MRTIICTIIPGKLPALPWTPTSYVVNQLIQPPKSPALPVTVIPIDPMVKGRIGVLQNHWRLVMNADALYLDKREDHLYKVARQYGLAIYAPLYDQAEDEDLFAAMKEAVKKPDDDDIWGNIPVRAQEIKAKREEVDLFGEGADLFAEPDLFAG